MTNITFITDPIVKNGLRRCAAGLAGVFLLLLTVYPTYGRRLTITTDTLPYSSGSVISFLGGGRPNSLDTFYFSGFGFRYVYRLIDTYEAYAYFNGIVFDTSSNKAIGVANISVKDDSAGPFGNRLISSSDTIWDSATQLPKSLYPIGRLTVYGSNSPNPDSLTGIWLLRYACNEGTQCANCIGDLLPNTSSIVYVHGQTSRNYKLQISHLHVHVDSIAGCPFPVSSTPESLYVAWAVDSSGNGQFHTPPVSTRFAQPSRTGRTLLGSHGSDQWFDIRGRRMPAGRIPGVFVDPMSKVKRVWIR
jgi:hypothetical protein